MNSLFQLDIPKRNTHCSNKGERLEAGMKYYSLLIEEGKQKFIRQDFCVPCWEESGVHKNLTDSKGHGYWQSSIEVKPPTIQPQQNKILKALSLLKEMLQQGMNNFDEQFVLALYLARAKHLVFRQEIEQEGEKYYLYEIPGQDEFLTIKKMKLSELEVAAIQKNISSKLS